MWLISPDANSASVKNETRHFISQIMECFGVDFKVVHGSETGKIDYRFSPDLIGSNNERINPYDLFLLLNQLFGSTYVYYEAEEGNNTSDSYFRKEQIYDPETLQIRCGITDYCYGDNTVFGDSVYAILKEEIEKQAVENGITISWCGEDYDFAPDWDNEEFSELCEDVICKYSLETLGTKHYVEKIEIKELEDDLIDTLIEKATAKGYAELLLLLQEKSLGLTKWNADELKCEAKQQQKFRIKYELIDALNDNSGVQINEQTNEILINTEVVGTMYEGRMERIENVTEETKVQVMREPKNQYNSNNLTVQNEFGESLGNISASVCDAVSPLIDKNLLEIHSVRVSRVEPKSKRGKRAKKAILFVEMRLKFI